MALRNNVCCTVLDRCMANGIQLRAFAQTFDDEINQRIQTKTLHLLAKDEWYPAGERFTRTY